MKRDILRMLQGVSWRCLSMVAAVYFYFLLFAQFAFLKLIENGVGQGGLKPSMAAMALAGIASSLSAARLIERTSPALVARVGMGGCAAMAGLALLGMSVPLAVLVAAGIGGGLGLATVTVVASLRRWMNGAPRWGLTIGLGTGLAYALCNVPWIFEASAEAQAILAGVAALAGSCLVPRSAPGITGGPRLSQLPGAILTGSVAAIVIFAMLVWLDSAAFFIIQHNVRTAAGTWGTEAMLWRNSLVHLLAAVLAGVLVTRRREVPVLFVSLLTLAAASLCVNAARTLWFGGFLYPAGVSLYSVCLVAFPAFLWYPHGQAGETQQARFAGWLFAIAGWLASGLGIGMAQNLHAVPSAFLVVATAIVTATLGWRRFFRHLPEMTATLVFLGIGVLFPWMKGRGSVGEAYPRRVDGREVYLAEGCIHCHSRYVRPESGDVLPWGPYVSYERLLEEAPPLFGNRRQGPDLLNVGLRRSPAWLRQHFLDPQSLAPGSVMPRYAHLFVDGRGEALIAFLCESSGSWEERSEMIKQWEPRFSSDQGDPRHGRELFESLCLACHGREGRGNGPLSGLLVRPPSNLEEGPFIYTGAQSPTHGLARVIKFGIFGTDMPGHETLADQEVADLAAYLLGLRSGRTSTSEEAQR